MVAVLLQACSHHQDDHTDSSSLTMADPMMVDLVRVDLVEVDLVKVAKDKVSPICHQKSFSSTMVDLALVVSVKACLVCHQ